MVEICDYEGSHYRTNFWEGQGREYEDRAERIALRKLLPPRGRRLIEIGAGYGRLAELYRGYDEVLLLDYALSQLQQARERLGDGRFRYIAADLYHMPLVDCCLDTAVMVRVMHHVQDPPAALSEIARILIPQGAFVLEYANKRSLFLRACIKKPGPLSPAETLFRCPICGASPLEPSATALTCPDCGRRWAIQDGIYNFKEPAVA